MRKDANNLAIMRKAVRLCMSATVVAACSATHPELTPDQARDPQGFHRQVFTREDTNFLGRADKYFELGLRSRRSLPALVSLLRSQKFDCRENRPPLNETICELEVATTPFWQNHPQFGLVRIQAYQIHVRFFTRAPREISWRSNFTLFTADKNDAVPGAQTHGEVSF